MARTATTMKVAIMPRAPAPDPEVLVAELAELLKEALAEATLTARTARTVAAMEVAEAPEPEVLVVVELVELLKLAEAMAAVARKAATEQVFIIILLLVERLLS
jgi:hypothetical protein